MLYHIVHQYTPMMLFSDKPVVCYKRYFTTALCLTSRVYTEVKKQELLNIEKQEELATSAVPSRT